MRPWESPVLKEAYDWDAAWLAYFGGRPEEPLLCVDLSIGMLGRPPAKPFRLCVSDSEIPGWRHFVLHGLYQTGYVRHADADPETWVPLYSGLYAALRQHFGWDADEWPGFTVDLWAKWTPANGDEEE